MTKEAVLRRFKIVLIEGYCRRLIPAWLVRLCFRVVQLKSV